MKRTALVLAARLFLTGTASAAPEASLETLSTDAVRLLQEYVRVDTINPPGNETRGVAFLAKILDGAGVEYETAESAPGRGNLWAHLEGGNEPAILLFHHIDVVPADKNHWTADPLGAEIRDGYVYGRGTLDTKTSGISPPSGFPRPAPGRAPPEPRCHLHGHGGRGGGGPLRSRLVGEEQAGAVRGRGRHPR